MITDHDTYISRVLAAFPALEPPKSTPFAVYAPTKNRSADTRISSDADAEEQDGQDFTQNALSVVGETDSILFCSTSESEAVQGGCRYVTTAPMSVLSSS